MAVVIDLPIRPETSPFDLVRDTHPTADTRVELTSNDEFLGAVLGKPQRFHYSSRTKLHVVNMPGARRFDDTTRNNAAYPVATVSLGIQAIHQAFAAHQPLSLRPDTLWYFIVHQVAEYVRQNTLECAPLFTDTPEAKQVILVRDDSLSYTGPSDWQRSINLVREPLAAKVSEHTMELFLPRFSTTTIEDETAMLVAFMETTSPYYEFRWATRCGIPQIRLEGTTADWQELHNRTERLASAFNGLRGYFADLLSVLETIAQTAGGATPNEDFWRSIYKYKDGSGGPYVNGWITAFFAYVQKRDGAVMKETFDWRRRLSGYGYTTNQFPSHVSRVPFVWDYLGRLYNMAFAAGVTGVDLDDNFLSPRLGFAVVEV